MIILGIDPGYAIVGWGVIEYSGSRFKVLGYGSIETPAHTPTESRLVQICEGIRELVEKYKPDAMAVEELFFNTNITTGIKVAEARGVIIMKAHSMGVKIAEYTPLQVKQAVVGYGRAEKKQVIMMVTRLLNLEKPPKPDDTADAVAVALCHAQSRTSRMAEFYARSAEKRTF